MHHEPDRRLRQVEERSPFSEQGPRDDAIIGLTSDGILTSWDSAAERLFGYSAAEMLGQPLARVFTPEDVAAGVPAWELQRAADEGRVEDERWHPRKGGDRFRASGVTTPVRDGGGRQIGFVKVVRDATARERDELDARDARAYAEAVVDTVREPLLVLDARLRVQTANRAFYHAFRVAPAETEGRPLYDLGGGGWAIPALRDLLEEIVPRDTAVEGYEVEHDFPRLGRRVMLLNARKLDREDDRAPRILLAIEDITERRRQERVAAAAYDDAQAARRRLHDLFMQAPALIGVLRGREGIVELFNPRFHQLWGNRDVVGKTMREAWPELEGQGYFELVERVYDTGEPVFGDEYPALIDRHNEGVLDEAFFNFVYHPTRDAAGAVDGVMIFGVEVTDQVRARREAEEAQRRLRAVLEQMPAGVIIAEAPSGRMLLSNVQVPAILGYPPVASGNLEGYAAYTALHADGTPYAAEEYPLVRAIT
ncbi:MAG: PAS domain-containing protein, partial [Chloroflexota bacterium]|nr:PAS domain-containing protein [Chloroflexota bacterium]